MATNKLTSTLLISIVVLTLAFFALPDQGVAGIGMDVGCCRTVDQDPFEPGGVCVGCMQTGCITLESYCESEGGFIGPGTCNPGNPAGATCGFGPQTGGCCVTAEQGCIDDIAAEPCFDGEGGIIYAGLTSCTELTECKVERDVPALGQWGFIALAAVLGLFAVIMIARSRKATV